MVGGNGEERDSDGEASFWFKWAVIGAAAYIGVVFWFILR